MSLRKLRELHFDILIHDELFIIPVGDVMGVAVGLEVSASNAEAVGKVVGNYLFSF